jgi:DNA-binding MarR family transcriptional regulator
MSIPPDPILHAALELRMLMITLHKAMMRRADMYLAANGIELSGLQFGMLRVLSQEPKTLSELSKNFMLDPSTLVPVVDALEAKGYVERRKDPKDRRRTPLHLTERALTTLAQHGWAGENEPLVIPLRALGSERAHTLVLLMRELCQQLPEAEDLMNEMEERLHTFSRHYRQPPSSCD